MDEMKRKAVQACPFCGSHRVLVEDNLDLIDRMDVRRIECKDCGGAGPVVRSDCNFHAVESWNWRGSFPENLSFVLRGFKDPWNSRVPAPVQALDAIGCPFCSSTRIVCDEPIEDDIWYARCVDCECEGPWKMDSDTGREAALSRWSDRVNVTKK